MNRISAADNLTIEMLDDRWRLIANGDKSERVVIEASPGRPLRYITGYGKSHRLPDNGALPVELIKRVVVGWSNQDESWHLGLVLGSELAQARGSRWCEVAHWPDPETSVYNEIATQAGEALAQAVARPFYLVPPQMEEKPAVAVTEPPPPLPKLPLTLDIWTFDHTDRGKFQFVRSKSWGRTALRRVVWYMFWAVIYVILVTVSFTSGIAPPRPEILPYLGILSAVILVILIIRNLYKLSTQPDRMIIDSTERSVTALRGSRKRWKFTTDEIQSVYVTLVTGKSKNKRPTFHYCELNLQLSNGDFHYMLGIEQNGVFQRDVDSVEVTERVDSLTGANVYTDIQAVGVYIAQALDIPCWYDQRA